MIAWARAAIVTAACLAGPTATGVDVVSAQGPAGAWAGVGATGAFQEGSMCNAMLVPLTVHVTYAVLGGARLPDGVPAPTPALQPLAGVEVDAVPAGDGSVAPVATGVTDNGGSVELDLPPGSYWVFVPQSAASTGVLSAASLYAMPDGTLVMMWQPVELASGIPTDVTLRTELPAP